MIRLTRDATGGTLPSTMNRLTSAMAHLALNALFFTVLWVLSTGKNEGALWAWMTIGFALTTTVSLALEAQFRKSRKLASRLGLRDS